MDYTSAQNTLYLRDVIGEGHTLADSSIIPTLNGVDFETLFKRYYWLYEIADENVEAWLFNLETRFMVVLPFYADKINLYNAMLQKLNTTYTRTTTSKFYEKPLGTEAEAMSDDNVQDANTLTETYTGVDASIDMLDRIGKIQDKIKNLYELLLQEFRGLFLNIQ